MYPSVITVHAGSLSVSVIQRTLTWNDRIFNARYGAYVIILKRAYTCIIIHTGVGHTDCQSAQQVLLGTEKFNFFSSADDEVGTSGHGHDWILIEADALPIEPSRHPIIYNTI